MIIPFPHKLHFIAMAMAWLLAFPAAARSAPVDVIFDTDMMTDCDDAGALAVLHALADRGECRIVATVVSSAGTQVGPGGRNHQHLLRPA